jgi:hypothetical protein
MPSELRPDDEVTDWQYQWQGPDGTESWWPAMPFVHAQIYMVTLFPAFLLGILLAWGFGTGLVSRVIPVVACLGITWLVVSEWVKHVDSSRPIAWHRAVLRSELRAPRPPRSAARSLVVTSAAHLVQEPAVADERPAEKRAEEPTEEPTKERTDDERPDREPWSEVLA